MLRIRGDIYTYKHARFVSLIWNQNIRLPTLERVTRRARDFHCVNIRISQKIKNNNWEEEKFDFLFDQGMQYNCTRISYRLFNYYIIIN